MLGRAQDELELSGEPRLADIFEHYAVKSPALRNASASILLSRNQEFATRDEVVHDGDEIGFLPPEDVKIDDTSNVISLKKETAKDTGPRDRRFRACPKCGTYALIRQEGCDSCTSCGFSKCS